MSVPGFLLSLADAFLAGLRHNKLPAILAVIALLVTTAFALNSQYDERERYRQVIFPDIERAEAQFVITMDDAKKAVNETWRLHYFIAAHSKARDVLRLARSRRPRTLAGIKAHDRLIRYYEFVTEHLAIIRTEMSIDERLDYLGEWEKTKAELQPIHDEWGTWVGP